MPKFNSKAHRLSFCHWSSAPFFWSRHAAGLIATEAIGAGDDTPAFQHRRMLAEAQDMPMTRRQCHGLRASHRRVIPIYSATKLAIRSSSARRSRTPFTFCTAMTCVDDTSARRRQCVPHRELPALSKTARHNGQVADLS